MLVDAVVDESVYVLDPLGRILSWNAAAERATGVSSEAVAGRSVAIFYRPEDVARAVPLEELAAAARTGSFAGEGWRVRADGQPFRARITLRAIRSRDNELVGFSRTVTSDVDREPGEPSTEAVRGRAVHVTASDTVDRLAAPTLSPDAALAALVVVLDAINENYLAVDGSWRFTAVGSGTARLIGHPAQYLIGRTLQDEVSHTARAAFLRDLPARLTHDRIVQYMAHDDETDQSTLVVASHGSAGYVAVMHQQPIATHAAMRADT